MGFLDWLNPQKIADNVTTGVTEKVNDATGGLISDIASLPSRIASGIWGAITGAFHGALSGVLDLWGFVRNLAIIEGVKKFAPQLYAAIVNTVEGPEGSARFAAHVRRDGLPGELLDSAVEAMGLNVAMGGISGAMDGASSSPVGKLGAGLLIAAGAAVTIGALYKGDVKTADSTSHSTPINTPDARPKTEPAKG